MKKTQIDLINELKLINAEATEIIDSFKKLSLSELNQKPTPNSWSTLECIEHLNLYCQFYIPEIKNKLQKRNPVPTTHFKSGLIGNYFINLIRVDNIKKMNSPKAMLPSSSSLSLKTIENFQCFLSDLDSILEEVKEVDLNKVKTAISLSKLIKLKLGDTLQFLLHHNKRHLYQAKNCLKK